MAHNKFHIQVTRGLQVDGASVVRITVIDEIAGLPRRTRATMYIRATDEYEQLVDGITKGLWDAYPPAVVYITYNDVEERKAHGDIDQVSDSPDRSSYLSALFDWVSGYILRRRRHSGVGERPSNTEGR